MKSLGTTFVVLVLFIMISILMCGVIGAFIDPQGYQDAIENGREHDERRKYLQNFELTQDEKQSYLRDIRDSVSSSLSGADVGVLVFERIDDKPNGEMVRYVVDKRVRVPGRLVKVRIRAMVSVNFDGTNRNVVLEFINVDDRSIR